MKELLLCIFLLIHHSVSIADELTVEDAYKQWVTVLDKELWVIKLYEPEQFESIKAGVLKDLENRSPKEIILFNIIKKQELISLKYLSAAPLAVLDEYNAAEINLYNYLIENEIPHCTSLFSDTPEVVNVIKKIPIEIIDKRKSLEKAIVAHFNNEPPKVDLAIGEGLFKDLVQTMIIDYGEPFENALGNPESPESDTTNVCQYLLELSKRISNLPDSEREHILRYSYSPE